jgi:hypothetical protein
MCCFSAYPGWLIAEGLLFVVLRDRQPCPEAMVRRIAASLGIERSELDRARQQLRISRVVVLGGKARCWCLPSSLRRGTDLSAFDPRWLRYEW